MRLWNKVHLNLTAGSCFLLAVVLLTIPLRWVLGWLLATVAHELSHYLALKSFRIHIFSLTVSPRGMRIETESMSLLQEFACACAGPIGALSILLAAKELPCAAICVCCQSAYNLLPIGMLDGGRALRCLAEALLTKDKADAFCFWLGNSIIILLLIAALYGMIVIKLGVLPVVAVLYLLFPGDGAKIPCKAAHLGVQYKKRNQRGI